MKKRVWSILLCMAMVVGMLPTVALAAEGYPSSVTLGGKELTYANPYLVSGEPEASGTLGESGCSAHYNKGTGVLTLNGYNGGVIACSDSLTNGVTIKLVGNNTITASSDGQTFGITSSGSNTLTITADDAATLTINVTTTGENIAAGIAKDVSNNQNNDSLVITGKAAVTVNATANNTAGTSKAYGIYTNCPVSITGAASFTSTSVSNAESGTGCQYGIFANNESVTINTTGNITCDVSTSGSTTANGCIYATGARTITAVGKMTLRYTYNKGYGIYQDSTVSTAATVAKNEGSKDGKKVTIYHSGVGTIHTLTLENGYTELGQSTGNYFSGDVVSIKTDETLTFDKWLCDGGSFADASQKITTFTMPDADAKLFADYNVFATQPSFIKTSTGQGNVTFELAGGVSPTYKRLVKSTETYSDTFSTNHAISSSSYTVYEGEDTYETPAGTYRIAVQVSGNWYYSNNFDIVYEAAGELTFADSTDYDIPAGTQGVTYTATKALTATGGTSPYTFSVDPAVTGLSVNGENKLVYTRPAVQAATTATIKVTDSASPTPATQTITIDIGAVTAAPTYSISLDKTGTINFSGAAVGYADQTPITVTVTNTGTNATGALTVALSGTNAESFTLSKTSISSITASGTDTFTVKPNTGLSAGTYTATVTVTGSNGINASFGVSFTVTTISKAEQVFASGFNTAETKSFGDSLTKTASLVAGQGDGAISYTSSNTEVAEVNSTTGVVTIKKVGTATITATAAETTNYAQTTTSYTLTVNPKTITPTVTVENGSVYNGTAKTPAVTVQTGSTTLVKDTDYTLEYSNNTNAGNTAKAIVTAKSGSNYTWASPVEQTFTIAPKAITIASATATNRDYEAGKTDVTISAVTFNGATLTKDTDYTVTGTMTDANAGTGKTVTVTVTMLNTTAAKNHSLSVNTASTTVTINKIAYSGSAIAATKSVLENKAQTGVEVDFTNKIAGITGAAVKSATEKTDTEGIISNVGTNGNKVTFDAASAAAGKTATIDVTISSTNFNDITATLTVTTVSKGDANVTLGAVPTSKTYGDSTFTLTATAANPGTNGAWTWSSNAPGVLSVTDAGVVTVKGAGVATIKATYESDTTMGDATSGGITVNKATVTVAAKNQSIYVNGTVPDLSSPVKDTHYTVTGLVGSDALTGTVAMKYQKEGSEVTPDATQTGTYDIVISGVSAPAGDNYNDIVLTNGTLTVSNKPSGGSSSGGSSSGGSSTTSAVTVPVSGDDGSVEVKASVSGSTATVDNIKTSDLEKIVDTATAPVEVVIDLTSLNKTIDKATIPNNTFKNVTEAANTDGNGIVGLEVKLTTGTVTLDGAALEAMQKQAGSSAVTIAVEPTKTSELSAKQQVSVKKLANPVLIDAYILAAGKRIGNFGDGSVKVTVPYKPVNGIPAVNYVSDNGSLTKIDCTYDKAAKSVTFMAPHFSYYAISSDGVEPCDGGESCPAYVFIDVDTAQWYHEAVDYAITNGLMNGYGNGKFAPNANLSRAMFCQILYNRNGRPDVTAENPFTDVPADEWYTDAVIWAYENNIVGGYGNGTFGPNNDITREQLATIIWSYDGKKASTVSLSAFSDAGKVSNYAVDALKWAYENGVMSGKGNGILDPLGKATRAQVAKMLMNYLEQ